MHISNDLDSLLGLAQEHGLRIIYLNLSLNDGLLGLHAPEVKTIFLDEKLLEPQNHKLHRCVLAEEIGHFITGTSVNALHFNYKLTRIITEEERKALLWATEKLIPTNEILFLLADGFFDCEELANYFGVTNWFMFRKLEFLQLQCKDREDIIRIRPIISKAKISCF